MTAPRERQAIAGLAAYEPGRPAVEVAAGLGGRAVVKLASNEGQFGPFPAALEAIAAAAPGLNRYPERGAELREALAARHGVSPARIALGNGADALVGYISMALLDPGDDVVLGWPSFVSYRLTALRMGATATTAPLAGAGYDVDAIAERIAPRTRIAYVCNPNNPTGGIVAAERLRAFAAAVPENVLIVVDEAYHEYVTDPAYPDAVVELGDRENVCVLRTFSKMYGLAGLRTGYAVAPEWLATAIAKVRPAFDVNELAMVAALGSLSDPGEVERRRELTAASRDRLRAACAAAGLAASESHGNFVCVHVGDGRATAAALEAQGIIVRPLEPFGDPAAVRITVGTDDEIDRLAAALERVPLAVP